MACIKYFKDKSLRDELIKLNEKFHDDGLLTASFYQQLSNAGVVTKSSYIIEVYPDGQNTYCGRIIRQDCKIIDYDIDLDVPENSIFKDVTVEFHKFLTMKVNSKSTRRETLALELFRAKNT